MTTPVLTHVDVLRLDEFGPYVPLRAAWRWLAYPSLDAARKAHARGQTPIAMLRLPYRRGLFVSTRALAGWLQQQQGGTVAGSAPTAEGTPMA